MVVKAVRGEYLCLGLGGMDRFGDGGGLVGSSGVGGLILSILLHSLVEYYKSFCLQEMKEVPCVGDIPLPLP